MCSKLENTDFLYYSQIFYIYYDFIVKCSFKFDEDNLYFGELKELIRSEYTVLDFYENKILKKRLKLSILIKLGAELEKIFRKLIHDLEVKESIPTDF